MKESDRVGAGNLIRFELKKGVHTFSMCKCGRNGCRSGTCWECWLEKLVDSKRFYNKFTQDKENEK